jgi:hypothetical protein
MIRKGITMVPQRVIDANIGKFKKVVIKPKSLPMKIKISEEFKKVWCK